MSVRFFGVVDNRRARSQISRLLGFGDGEAGRKHGSAGFFAWFAPSHEVAGGPPKEGASWIRAGAFFPGFRSDEAIHPRPSCLPR